MVITVRASLLSFKAGSNLIEHSPILWLEMHNKINIFAKLKSRFVKLYQPDYSNNRLRILSTIYIIYSNTHLQEDFSI